MTFCPCNVVILPTSQRGGLSVGGSALLSTTICSGGVVVGGTAIIRNLYDPADGFAAWWLLQEDGSGFADEYKDQTRYHLDGTGGGGNPAYTPSQTSGVFCRFAQDFESRQYITLPMDLMDTTSPITVTLWAQIATYGQPRTFFSRGFQVNATGATNVFNFGYTNLDQIVATVFVTDGETTTRVQTQGFQQLEQGRWYHFACVWNPGNSLTVFVNGVSQNSISTTYTETVPYTNGNFIGRLNNGGMPQANIEDLRVYPSVKDAAWLATEYACICDSGFCSFGVET